MINSMKRLELPYKVLVLDLDGTVVNHDLTVSPRLQDRLTTLIHKTDCRIIIATGRMSLSAARFAGQLGVTEPVISYQGAMIRDANGNRMYHQPVPLPIARQIVRDLGHQGIAVNVYIDDVLYMHHSNPHQEAYARLGGTTPVLVTDLEAAVTEAPTKLLVIDDTRCEAVLQYLEQTFPGQLASCMSRHNFVEVIEAGVSKWAGLQHLIPGVPPEAVMAIGDQGNDLPMLTQAGLGIAMGNAPDWVKAQVRYITDPINADGVAKAIDRYLLQPIAVR
jgi:Cof subfamily protein (haloacid dehalogenase superfamily)